jgi:hypothetical protein
VVELITQHEARGDSPRVTLAEYRDAQTRGKQLLDTLWVSDGWDEASSWAYNETRKNWGGVTIDSRTGDVVSRDSGYAVSAKMPGERSIACPFNISEAGFQNVLTRARNEYSAAPYLGIFHDDETGTIEFDPVVIVETKRDARDIGTYTEALGGAYDFTTGNGVFPFHVSTSNAKKAA